MYVEVICDDEEVLVENLLSKIRSSPDFQGMDEQQALADLKVRIANYEAVYEPVEDNKLSYIKLYRIQPEPEFVYLSDARIPPTVADSQVRHDLHQLVTTQTVASSDAGAVQLLDERSMQQIASDKMARSPEETYYKFRGEEVLKGSGLR